MVDKIEGRQNVSIRSKLRISRQLFLRGIPYFSCRHYLVLIFSLLFDLSTLFRPFNLSTLITNTGNFSVPPVKFKFLKVLTIRANYVCVEKCDNLKCGFFCCLLYKTGLKLSIFVLNPYILMQ